MTTVVFESIIILALCVSVTTSPLPSQDNEYIKVQVQQHTPAHFLKRDVGPRDGFPSKMRFSFRFNESVISLNLDRNIFLNPDVMVADENGPITLDTKTNVGVYHDHSNKAAILVICKEADKICKIQGTLQLEGELWSVKPIDDLDNLTSHKLKRHILINPNGESVHDAISPPGFNAKQRAKTITGRQKRAERHPMFSDCFVVEVAAFPDHTVFEHFKATYHTDRAAKMELKNFLLALYNQVDLRFSMINQTKPGFCIRVALALVQLASSTNKPTWSTRADEHYDGLTYMNGRRAIFEFGEFANTIQNMHGKPHFDHAQGFTRRDISLNVHTWSFYEAWVKGLAFKGTICVKEWIKYQASIVQILGPQSALVAAHEIGHALGAGHDSDEGCDDRDGFIMANNSVGAGDVNQVMNSWMFSSCSVDRFWNHIECNSDCLRREDPNTPDMFVSEQLFSLPGMYYCPDDQCKLGNGPDSDYCNPNRDISEFQEDICSHGAGCTFPGTDVCNSTVVVFAGTACGVDKVCIEGQCKDYTNSDPTTSTSSTDTTTTSS